MSESELYLALGLGKTNNINKQHEVMFMIVCFVIIAVYKYEKLSVLGMFEVTIRNFNRKKY